MGHSTKTAQLQIRVSAEEKLAMQRAARRAGLGLSAYVLGRVLPAVESRYQQIVEQLRDPESTRYTLAELNGLLGSLSAAELRQAVASPLSISLPLELSNYVAAMVEMACAHQEIEAPAWLRSIAPLAAPVFGTQLMSLRLYLLAHSPPPFRRRNIFIDTSIGGQV
jgi:hypothetical protein